MAQSAMETLPSTREFEQVGFSPQQARLLGQSMHRTETMNKRIFEDLKDLRRFVEENMVTKDEIKDLLTKDDIKDLLTRNDIKGLVTEAQMQVELKQLYRLLFVGMMGICGLILALIPIMLTLHLAG